MTIGTTSSVITVQGNGATTTFAYPFLIPAASDAVITYTAVGGIQTVLTPTQFTITGIENPLGGTVTYPLSGGPIPSGSSLTIQRILPVVQTTSISNQGPTFAAIESEDDYLTMLIQQVNNQAERAIVINPADVNLPTPLPVAAVRAGQYLYFDANGNPTVSGTVTPVGVPVSNAMVPVLGASTTALALELLGGVAFLSNIAALAAYTGPTQSYIYISGYYATNDGGQGFFISGTAATADGGSVIHDANGNSWYRQFGGGGPYSVRCWGAYGNGSTNDFTAIQNAINYCTALSVGPVYFPEGNYIVNSGLTLTSNYVSLVGDTTFGALVQAGNGSMNLLTLTNCEGIRIENMWFNIPQVPAAVTCVTLSGCVECHLSDCRVTGGQAALYFLNSTDNSVVRCTVYNSYGPQQVYLVNSSSIHFLRCKIDQGWPAGTPSQGNLFGAWAASTAYTGVDVVSLNGYYYQCIGGGTSGTTPFSVATYGTNITDGSVTWQLACFTNLVAVQLDTGSDVNYFFECDAAGAYLGGYLFTNNAAGFGPQKNTITNSNFDSYLQFGVRANSGAGLIIDGCTFGPAVESDALGINLENQWTGDCTISNCLMTGGLANGIEVDVGTNAVISSNQIYGCTGYGVLIAANVNQFTITGNQLGQSTSWGTNAHGITVQTGTSNFYVISGNNTAGASSGVTDGGSGGSKYVGGNI